MKPKRSEVLRAHYNPKLFVLMGDMRGNTPNTVAYLMRRVPEFLPTGELDLLIRLSSETCRLMQLAEPFHAHGEEASREAAETLDRQILGRLPYYTLVPLPALLALQNRLLGISQ